MAERVKVVVRIRPMNQNEKQRNCTEVVKINENGQIVLINQQHQDVPKVFAYDSVFNTEITQATIYQQTAFPLVQSVVEGYNGTIFAYGQTGCGKTHTMIGHAFDNFSKGIIPRTFQHLIQIIESQKSKNFLLRCAFIEIYNEQIHDLLGKDIKEKKQMKESTEKGIYIKNLTIPVVKTFQEMNTHLQIGFKNRSTAATAMNKDSSRSHSVFTIYIQTQEGQMFKGAKLNLVDLAGSERQSKTQATGDRLKQAAKINLSLSALGNVICALVDGKSKHIPYRDSKLTRLLEDSLGGNTKTIMIANVSPSNYNYDETLSTLRYASRAKKITNKPIINEDPKDAMLRKYAQQIQLLKNQLNQQHISGGVVNISNNGHFEQEKKSLLDKIKQLQGQVLKSHSNTENRKYKDLKNKLKKEKGQREKIQEQARKAEQQLLQFNENFKNAQEMAKKYKQGFFEAKNKYKMAIAQINDIQRQNLEQKERLTDQIRQTQLQRDFYQQVCLKMLTKQQLQQIRQKSKYDDNILKYRVPAFMIKAKQIQFPKLGKHSEQLINHHKLKNEISFQQKALPRKDFSSFKQNSSKQLLVERRRLKTVLDSPDIVEVKTQARQTQKNVVLAPLKTQPPQIRNLQNQTQLLIRLPAKKRLETINY